jgi:hypothetical protein
LPADHFAAQRGKEVKIMSNVEFLQALAKAAAKRDEEDRKAAEALAVLLWGARRTQATSPACGAATRQIRYADALWRCPVIAK